MAFGDNFDSYKMILFPTEFKDISKFDNSKTFSRYSKLKLNTWMVNRYLNGANDDFQNKKITNTIFKKYTTNFSLKYKDSISRWENEFTFHDFMYETGGRM